MHFDYYRDPLDSFPDVVIHADESAVRSHPAYEAAKTGDSDAAYSLVYEYLNEYFIRDIQNFISRKRQRWLPFTQLRGKG